MKQRKRGSKARKCNGLLICHSGQQLVDLEEGGGSTSWTRELNCRKVSTVSSSRHLVLMKIWNSSTPLTRMKNGCQCSSSRWRSSSSVRHCSNSKSLVYSNQIVMDWKRDSNLFIVRYRFSFGVIVEGIFPSLLCFYWNDSVFLFQPLLPTHIIYSVHCICQFIWNRRIPS